MKRFKTVISVLLAAVLVASVFAACKGEDKKDDSKEITTVVAVTDENGKEVTDKNGETVTEVITVESTSSDAEGGVVVIDETDKKSDSGDKKDSGKNSGADKDKKENNNKSKDSKTQNTTKDTTDDKKDGDKKDTDKKDTVKKPEAPSKPTGLVATKVTTDGLLLSWNGVTCDGYELGYKKADDSEWKSKDGITSTKVSFEKALISYTVYKFRVRAYNENSAGRSASTWVNIDVRTKADEKNERFIKVKVIMPTDSNKADVLQIYVDGELDSEFDVHCNGKSVTKTTSKKYKGLVEVKAVLKGEKSGQKAKTDKDSIKLDASKIGIEVDVDDEPF